MAAQPARADAIDGDWCHADGRHIEIHGPAIVTPGGNAIRGDYDRHAFAYVVPAGEPAPGTKVRMVLRGEYDVDVTFGDAPAERWKRCAPKVS
ncbi:MAG: hypothetical protein EXQ97_07295 [Alphaproteobacteria bacterium]|nr:hypothetical protein [Alphaproteobacteria bacterium]